ncbi:hypothetical protein C7S15_4381 [Burkholderia cepacia]|nr:hypothetical protein [Burkholderia cepacia]
MEAMTVWSFMFRFPVRAPCAHRAARVPARLDDPHGIYLYCEVNRIERVRLPRLNDRSIAPSTVALQIDQNTRVP